jgi:hypothetical protein
VHYLCDGHFPSLFEAQIRRFYFNIILATHLFYNQKLIEIDSTVCVVIF